MQISNTFSSLWVQVMISLIWAVRKKNFKIFVNRLLIQLVDYLPYILANYFVKQ